MKVPALALTAAAALFLGLGLASALPQDDDARAKRIHASVGYIGESTLVLPVTDLEESLAFYQEKLGFTFLFKAEGMAFAEVQSPSSGLAIGLSQREDAAAGGSELTLGVADIDKARAALEKLGVKFEGDTVEYPGLVKLAYFKDPTGHTLMLHQSLMQPESDK